MLFNIWRFIQLWLPYWVILRMYKRNKALPANIRTRQGNNYKAILITEDYGVLFSEDKYIENRAMFLKEQKKILDLQNDMLIKEINSLPFEERERLYGHLKDDNV